MSNTRKREERMVYLMKNKVALFGAVALLAQLALVWAADITGSWIAHLPGRKGTVETVFYFKVDGPKLSGTISSRQGKDAITEGKINGDEITFVAVRSLGGNDVRFVYKGKVAGDEIKFTSEVQGGMGQQRQEFVAKREFQRNGDIPNLRK
jgi:hypothetical protein